MGDSNKLETAASSSAPMTPMLAQYWALKKEYPDALLFYRMGDFYEMFYDDALTAAPILEVTLTSRDKSASAPIPMCGVPFHSVTPYLQKLIARGYKVALCEQMEDPATAKGLVKRDVVRIVTPALIGDPELTSEDSRNFLVAIREAKSFAEIFVLDLFASESRTGTVNSQEELFEFLSLNRPKECLLPENARSWPWFEQLRQSFPEALFTFREVNPKSKNALPQMLKAYLKETQKIDALNILGEPRPLCESNTMRIDSMTASSLELLPNAARPESVSLFQILDFTVTPMGRRLLKDWIINPLADKEAITDRQEAVEEFVEQPSLREQLKSALKNIRDLERLATKTALFLSMPRDLVAIREIQKQIPLLIPVLTSSKSPELRRISAQLSEEPELTSRLEAALEDCPAATLREGGIFRASFHSEIAELRSLSQDAKSTIANLESREKERTGISSLKVKYSKVFGYTIEITNSHLAKVPSTYIRKQTIANGERFITEELKNFEEKVITAEFRLKTLEERLFLQLRREVAERAPQLIQNAKLLAQLDILQGFAQCALERGYRRPKLGSKDKLKISEGRHPVVETILPSGKFIPNTVEMSSEEGRTILITGPNMGGKSTIMRQVALICVLAQMGSFVPAESASLPVFDALFTRIGSSDDLSRGRSTFMVEMSETSRILRQATAQSLILIDEIGRGTSTYDGLSLAWSLLEFLHQEVRAKTLFATHFHELTQLEDSLPGLRNMNVLVEKWKDDVVFLYKLGRGICQRSYGIEVARLAGLPPKVLSRAREILGVLETQSQRGARGRQRALETHTNQMVFFDGNDAPKGAPELNH